MNLINDFNLVAFKAISKFINDLGEIYALTDHQLRLYQRLINKTTLNHDVAIKKHLNAFKKFCVSNRVSILNKNLKVLKEKKVKYSERVYIDLHSLMHSSDSDTLNTIWKHLLTISAIVDPAANAKEILKKSQTSESNILQNILEKVEANVDMTNTTNPLEAVSSIMSSGILSDIMETMNSGIKDGSLNIPNLIGTVQNMVTTLGGTQAGEGEPNPLAGIDLMNVFNQFAPMLNPQVMSTSMKSTETVVTVDNGTTVDTVSKVVIDIPSITCVGDTCCISSSNSNSTKPKITLVPSISPPLPPLVKEDDLDLELEIHLDSPDN